MYRIIKLLPVHILEVNAMMLVEYTAAGNGVLSSSWIWLINSNIRCSVTGSFSIKNKKLEHTFTHLTARCWYSELSEPHFAVRFPTVQR